MADSPSRGGLVPGPCAKTPLYAEKRNAVRPPYVRPRGRGLGYAAVRIGEASHPGPGPPTFWSPLLAGRVGSATLHKRYMPAVRDFVAFVADYGDSVDSAAECEYWLAFYMHTSY